MNSSHASRTQRAIMAAASLVLLACTTLIAHAQVTPGEYVYPGGFGVLKIVASKGGALQFDIEVVGGNFHTCNLSGVIRNNEARMEESADDKQPCIVTFKPQKDGLAVDSKFGRACSTYCGMRADFTGVYQRPPSGCAPSQVRHSRNRFKAAYDKNSTPRPVACSRPWSRNVSVRSISTAKVGCATTWRSRITAPESTLRAAMC